MNELAHIMFDTTIFNYFIVGITLAFALMIVVGLIRIVIEVSIPTAFRNCMEVYVKAKKELTK